MIIKNKIRFLTTLAIFIALDIIFSRLLVIQLPTMKFSLTFIIEALIGSIFGPIWSAIGLVIADLIGIWLNPSTPFFLGFTVNAALIGLIYGFFFYKKKKSWLNIVLATTIITLVINLLLTTFWLHIMLKTPMSVLLISRLPSELVRLVLQSIIIKIIFNCIPKKFQTL